ncbi:MAG: hypothetical protein LBM98_03805 [Oscillospiraceae bacterium]|nr:hypothetical protein [Oscillospiraceae bacterium]
MDVGCVLRGNHPAAAAAPLHRGDRGRGLGRGARNPGGARCVAPTSHYNI